MKKALATSMALLFSSGVAIAGDFIGAIRCGERVAAELDTARNVGNALWRVSDDVAAACGMRENVPVQGEVIGEELVLSIPPALLAERSITTQPTPQPGTPATWLDWTVAGARSGGGNSTYARLDFRHGRAIRVSGWRTENGGALEQAYWQDQWRIGRWFSASGTLQGVQYGPDDDTVQPTTISVTDRFRIPVFGQEIRILDPSGREVRRVPAKEAGIYDVSELVASAPRGSRIAVDGQVYEPAVEQVLQGNLGLQWFAGNRTYSDIRDGRRKMVASPFGYVRFPVSRERFVSYGTLTSEGGRFDAYARWNGLSFTGYATRERRGEALFASVAASGVTLSLFRPSDEYARRSGAVGYTILSATQALGPGFANAFAVRYDTGTRVESLRYTYPIRFGLVQFEASRQKAAGQTDTGFFVTATFFLDRATVRAATNGSFFAEARSNGLSAGVERTVTLDGRRYDYLRADAELAAARVLARYCASCKALYASANGRLVFEGGDMYATRSMGDGFVKISGPAGAAVTINGVQGGKLDRNGRGIFPVPAGMALNVTVDDEDALSVAVPSTQTTVVRAGEVVEVEFRVEPLK